MQTEKQRERLVELIKNADSYENLRSYDLYDLVHDIGGAEEFADYLMSNNVVVLPCKVGDKIFAVSASLKTIYECKVTHIISQEGGLMIFGTLPYCKEPRAICSEYDIGKDYVFLSRAEAEAKLREMRDGT
jgi:hypothetical protein